MEKDQAMSIILAMIQAGAIVPRHLKAYQEFVKTDLSETDSANMSTKARIDFLRESGAKAAAYLDALPIVALYNELTNPTVDKEKQGFALDYFVSSLKQLGISTDKAQ